MSPYAPPYCGLSKGKASRVLYIASACARPCENAPCFIHQPCFVMISVGMEELGCYD